MKTVPGSSMPHGVLCIEVSFIRQVSPIVGGNGTLYLTGEAQTKPGFSNLIPWVRARKEFKVQTQTVREHLLGKSQR